MVTYLLSHLCEPNDQHNVSSCTLRQFANHPKAENYVLIASKCTLYEVRSHFRVVRMKEVSSLATSEKYEKWNHISFKQCAGLFVENVGSSNEVIRINGQFHLKMCKLVALFIMFFLPCQHKLR